MKTQDLTLLYVNNNQVCPISKFFEQYSHYILLELLQQWALILKIIPLSGIKRQ